MATKRKTKLRLETGGTVRSLRENRPVIIRFNPSHPEIIELSLKGERLRLPVNTSSLYLWALDGHIMAERARKRKERKKKK